MNLFANISLVIPGVENDLIYLLVNSIGGLAVFMKILTSKIKKQKNKKQDQIIELKKKTAGKTKETLKNRKLETTRNLKRNEDEDEKRIETYTRIEYPQYNNVSNFLITSLKEN